MTRRPFLLIVLALAMTPVFAADKSPITDDRIYDQVLLKLAGDPDVKGGGIQVEVHQGVVTLKGRVTTDHAKSKAEKLVKKVKGVVSVQNQLVVGHN